METYRYVPGSVLRGALAAAWIREHGKPRDTCDTLREQFHYLFEGPVRYGPLFDPASVVVPLSVLRCKYRPKRRCRYFFHDEAVAPASGDGETASRRRCDVCQGATEPARGEVEFLPSDDDGPHVINVTRTALDNERAAQGALFTRRALSAGRRGAERTLTGRIIAPDADRASWLLHEHFLQVGGRRSTGGAAVYTASADRDATASLPDPAAAMVDDLLLVRLTSPALLVDAAGRPARHPDAQVLSRVLGFPDGSVSVVDSWVRREQIGGWHALTNLPKPTELAVTAGSVFRLRLPATPTAEQLRHLVNHGLGVRRTEGFGWIELGPWRSPHSPADDPEPAKTSSDSVGQRLAEDLHALTDKAGWFHDKLRDCLRQRQRGDSPDLAFLDSGEAEVLHGKGGGTPLRQRVENLVLYGDESQLEQAVQHLRRRSSSTGGEQ